MASIILTGIGQLITCAPGAAAATSVRPSVGGSDEELLGVRTGVAVVVDDGRVAWIGPENRAPAADSVRDIDGRCLIPAFVDSHTHLVFAGDRSAEFAARMAGSRYDGGGIATTVAATKAASDRELTSLTERRLAAARAGGTGVVEIKSGYGLDAQTEARILQVAQRFTPETTYLGAHVVPPGWDHDAYTDYVCGPMLRACAPHARWVDVFCEPNSPHAFDGDQARAVLQAGIAAGLLPRVHGNQLGHGPGVQLACELGAASVDHCTYLSSADIDALAQSGTVATLLPGVEFSTRSPYPDAAKLWAAGVRVALASDCNPGTCYSASMPLMIQLAVREMGLTVPQALWAATRGGALALNRNDIGIIAPGALAEFSVVDAPNYEHLAYHIGMPVASYLDV